MSCSIAVVLLEFFLTLLVRIYRGYVAVFRAFIQAKPRYQTEAEKRGYSWVFEGHVINMAAAYDQRVLPHPDGRPHWHAVRNASWHQVHQSAIHNECWFDITEVIRSYRRL